MSSRDCSQTLQGRATRRVHPTMKPPPRRETLWRKRSQALTKAWPDIASDEEALHQARVASRRIREILPILIGGKPARLQKLRRRFRRITKALGTVRELDVALKVLTEIQGVHPAARVGIEYVRERVITDRKAACESMAERVESIDIDKLCRRINEAIEGESKEPTRDWSAWRAVLVARVARRAEALRAAIDRAGALYLPDRLHAVRLAVKKLRYALELVQESNVARSTRSIRLLKTTQDTLGRLHDLEVLTECARSVQASIDSKSGRHMAEVDRVIRLLEDECRLIHATYVGAREGLTEICDVAVPSLKQALDVARPEPARVLSIRPRTARRSTAADRSSSRALGTTN